MKSPIFKSDKKEIKALTKRIYNILNDTSCISNCKEKILIEIYPYLRGKK